MSKVQETQTKLLDAAEAEFSESGLAGARVDRIAERSEVNKQRVYAYFGSKDALFAAVLSRAFQRLTERVPIPTTVDELARYAGDVFDHHRRHPELVRLLAWEGLRHHDEPVALSYDRSGYYAARTGELATSLGFADPAEAARVVLAVVGMASWPFVVPQQRRLLLGNDGDSPNGWALLRASVVAAGEAVVMNAQVNVQA